MVWVKMTYFHRFFRTIHGVLSKEKKIRGNFPFQSSRPILKLKCLEIRKCTSKTLPDEAFNMSSLIFPCDVE